MEPTQMCRFRVFTLAFACAIFLVGLLPSFALAQGENSGSSRGPLTFATVERALFSFTNVKDIDGCSIELMRAIGEEMRRPVEFVMQKRFSDMLNAI